MERLSAYETDVDVQEFDAFDKVTFGHVDFGMRLHLANSGRRWVPYGDLAVTFWPVSDILKNGERTTTDFSGRPPYSLGGGLAILGVFPLLKSLLPVVVAFLLPTTDTLDHRRGGNGTHRHGLFQEPMEELPAMA